MRKLSTPRLCESCGIDTRDPKTGRSNGRLCKPCRSQEWCARNRDRINARDRAARARYRSQHAKLLPDKPAIRTFLFILSDFLDRPFTRNDWDEYLMWVRSRNEATKSRDKLSAMIAANMQRYQSAKEAARKTEDAA